MRIRFLLPLLVALSVLVSASAVGQDVPSDGHTIDGLAHPESVAWDEAGNAFYVSNIGAKLAPAETDGDGFVSRLAPDGTLETLRYLPGPDSDVTLHAPKGVAVVNGHVFTADIDRVLGFDGDSREMVMEVDLADQGAAFLNDVTAMDASTLFVSDSQQGVIYRVNLDDGTATPVDVDVPGVNGLVYAPAEGVLYAVTYGGGGGGELWTLEIADNGTVASSASRTVVEGGRFDGVVLHPNNQLLVSDWGPSESEGPPALHRTSRTSDALTTIELSGWSGPADFTCTQGACWIPDLPASVVRIVRPDARAE